MVKLSMPEMPHMESIPWMNGFFILGRSTAGTAATLNGQDISLKAIGERNRAWSIFPPELLGPDVPREPV